MRQYISDLQDRVQELRESQGGRPAHPVPNKPYGGRKAP